MFFLFKEKQIYLLYTVCVTSPSTLINVPQTHLHSLLDSNITA